MASRTIQGDAAKKLGRAEKWAMLSPFLTQHGREALSYATLQEGMEYFIDDTGYIAFVSITHPVFAPKGRRIALSDPVCAPEHLAGLVGRFLADHPHAVFAVVSENCAAALRPLGFKANCIGFEPEIPIPTYNTKGNWKDLDMIKRARNEAKREGLVIREEDVGRIPREKLEALSSRWIGTKKVNDREIWIYARRAIFEAEPDVRKFVAFDREGTPAGFVFYDPMYRAGRVVGYSANTSRCDEQKYGRLATAIHMEAVDVFRTEGREVMNLCLAPFVKLDEGKYNDDFATKWFFRLSEQYGNNIYNFKGLSFHKSKYRVPEKFLYFVSNSALPSNDVYLAFLSSDIARSYFETVGRLLWGVITHPFTRRFRPEKPEKPEKAGKAEKPEKTEKTGPEENK
jgi:lysylphosphatidylglycerol synthetase-like protein (DUF2156 family)